MKTLCIVLAAMLAASAFTLYALVQKIEPLMLCLGGVAFALLALRITLGLRDKKTRLQIENDQGFRVYHLGGTLDGMGEGPGSLREALETDFSLGNYTIILDMKKVVRLTTTVAASLHEYARKARQNGGDIQFFGLNIDDTLVTTRLCEYLASHVDQIAAVCHFGTGRRSVSV